MKNKKTIFITGFMALGLFGLLAAMPTVSNSATTLPHQSPNTCQQVVDNGMEALNVGWMDYAQNVADQEQAASRQADDIFDSVRTYRCWMESFCRSVQVSATFPTLSGALSSDQLGTEPGCADPEDMELPASWGDFLATVDQGASSFTPPNPPAFAMIPQCRVAPEQALTASKAFYDYCLNKIEKEFGPNNPDMLTKLTTLMTGAASEKKTRALENKLISINQKLDAMAGRVVMFTQSVHEVFNRLPCTISECQQGQ